MTQPLNYATQGAVPDGFYYRYSNRVDGGRLIVGGAGALVAGLLMAVVYAYFTASFAGIYVRAVCPLLFGASLALVTSRFMRWARVRSPAVWISTAIIIAVAAYLFHWFAWVHAIVNRGSGDVSFILLLQSPLGVLRFIRGVYDSGTWGMSRGEPESGVILGIIWIGEVALIFGAVIKGVVKLQTAVPFCEGCNVWCGPATRIRSVGPCDGSEFKRRMEAKDWAFLDQLGPGRGPGRIVMTFHACRRCRNFHTLSAVAMHATISSRGRTRKSKEKLIHRLIVDADDLSHVRQIAQVIE